MEKNNIEYEYICGLIVPSYFYKEGDKHETYWVDSQNALYHVYNDVDDDTGLIDGKKWWLLDPRKPKGTTLTEENAKDLVKWFVDDSYDGEDVDKEWDFKEHKPIEIKTNSNGKD